MTRTELIAQVAAELGCTKVDATRYVETVFDVIADAMRKGDKVNVTGFGTFDVRERAEREGVDPTNKNRITIPASKTVGFRASQKMKETLN